MAERCSGSFTAQALGQDILDASQLKHRADRTAGNHPGTGGCWTHQHAGSAIAAGADGGDGVGAGQGHLDQVLLAIGNTLFDGADDVTGFADANADLALLVANDNDGRKLIFLPPFTVLETRRICTTRSCHSESRS